MLKSCLYARTSTQRQENEETINSQIDEIERKIREDGNILLPQHIYKDDGWSGTILARPALDAMRDGAKNHDFDIVYVYDRGRLSREFYVQEMIIDELRDLDIKFFTLHDINVENENDRLMQGVQGLFHQYERVKIAERFRRGKMYKVNKGELLGYNPLYGYRYIPIVKKGNGEKENGRFEINEEEAEVVRKIFDWVGNKGYSLNMVIKELYEQKIYPKKRRRDFWTNGPINRIIRNTSYFGDHYYNKSTGAVPKNPKVYVGKYKKTKKSSSKAKPREEWILYKIKPIITRELFDKAQEQMKLNTKYCIRNKKYNYLLSGKVYCTCGQKRCGESVKKDGKINQYYRCCDRIYNYPIPKTCFERSVNANVLDKIVYDNLVSFLTNENLIEKQTKRWFVQKEGIVNHTGKIEINKLQLQSVKLKEEESRYVQLYGTNNISMDIYRERMEDINNRRERILNEIRSKEKDFETTNSFPKWDMTTVCNMAKEFIKDFDINEKMQVVRAFVRKVVTNQQLAVINGFIPIGVNTEKEVLSATDRHHRFAKCWQVNNF